MSHDRDCTQIIQNNAKENLAKGAWASQIHFLD
jgi:hypothetical protein